MNAVVATTARCIPRLGVCGLRCPRKTEGRGRQPTILVADRGRRSRGGVVWPTAEIMDAQTIRQA